MRPILLPLIAALLALPLGAIAQEAEVHTFHCWRSCPVGAPATNDLVVREIYTLSSNDETKLADWVAYRIGPDTVGPSENRVWREDPWLSPGETLEPEDYDGANAALHTDRGHQAPLAALSGTGRGADTNILSNITPQRSDLNQGPWERLEAAERAYVDAHQRSLYVLTGPLYERVMPGLPEADEPHRVPSAYWKVIVSEDGMLAAFIFEQETPRRAFYCTGLSGLDVVEARSGLRLFPALETRSFQPLAPHLGC